METKHHRYTRRYTLLQVLWRGKKKKEEDRKRGKHEGEGSQDPGGARAIVTGLGTLSTQVFTLDKGSSPRGGMLGPGAYTGSLLGCQGLGRGPLSFLIKGETARTMEQGGLGRRWGGSLPSPDAVSQRHTLCSPRASKEKACGKSSWGIEEKAFKEP